MEHKLKPYLLNGARCIHCHKTWDHESDVEGECLGIFDPELEEEREKRFISFAKYMAEYPWEICPICGGEDISLIVDTVTKYTRCHACLNTEEGFTVDGRYFRIGETIECVLFEDEDREAASMGKVHRLQVKGAEKRIIVEINNTMWSVEPKNVFKIPIDMIESKSVPKSVWKQNPKLESESKLEIETERGQKRDERRGQKRDECKRKDRKC